MSEYPPREYDRRERLRADIENYALGSETDLKFVGLICGALETETTAVWNDDYPPPGHSYPSDSD